ncbi:MAG: hypothetical protein KKA73_01410, partial [Chloroflexi bacterium]|nr:hypothetical protein [Chloroflexota bacterium]
MGKAGKLAAAAAQHGSLSRQTSMAGLAGPLRTIDELVIAHLEYRTQPREIIPPDLLQHLIAKGRNHPPEVLQALQRQAADDETAQRILAGLEELATTIRPPGQVHVPILCYRDGATWVVYSGHRRCLASLLAGRNTVPAIEISPTSSAERELDRIVIETSHEDWTAVELALALRDARDQLRAEWEGKTPAEVGLVQLAVSAEDLAEDFSQPGLTEGSALLGADPQASQFSQ